MCLIFVTNAPAQDIEPAYIRDFPTPTTISNKLETTTVTEIISTERPGNDMNTEFTYIPTDNTESSSHTTITTESTQSSTTTEATTTKPITTTREIFHTTKPIVTTQAITTTKPIATTISSSTTPTKTTTTTISIPTTKKMKLPPCWNCYYKEMLGYPHLEWTSTGLQYVHSLNCFRCCYYFGSEFAGCTQVSKKVCDDYHERTNLNIK